MSDNAVKTEAGPDRTRFYLRIVYASLFALWVLLVVVLAVAE